jgi:hypothetical protein
VNKLLRVNAAAFAVSAAILLSSCSKDGDKTGTPQYTVPATYAFDNVDYSSSTIRVSMMVKLDAYMKKATTTKLKQDTVNNMFNNTGNPFGDARLDASGLSLAEKTSDAVTFKSYVDSVVSNSQMNNIQASEGVPGFLPRGTGKIIVGANGIEYGQAALKGMMGGLFFKEAMAILSKIPQDDNNTVVAGQGTAMQHHWDEAFGYLAIPADYDTSKTYTSADANRPLLWGGYLAERGKAIQAGGILFEAFRKGRAAIGAKDYTVRDEAIKAIQSTWERLAAAAALAYVTQPQSSANIGNLGAQFHALSEGHGFIAALKYRAAGSKLSDADYQKLVAVMNISFYTLVNEAGFKSLNEAKDILTKTYDL